MLLTAVTTEDEPDNTRKEIKALEEDTTALDASFAGAAARSGDAGAPTDWLVLSVFFLQGVGQLFPWNVFINAESYFARRLCGTPFAANFESWFGVGYNVAAVAGLIIALRYALPQRLKILGGLAVSALVFGACVLLVFDAAMDGAVLFALTMALVCASAVAVAFAQSGLFGLASGYPPEHTQAMMSGQGVAGLIVAVTNYIAVASQPEPPLPKDCSDPARGAVSMPLPAATSAGADDCVPYEFDGGTAAYFAVATATLVACVGGYLLLEARRGSSGGGVGGGGMCELNDSGHRRRQRRGDAGVDGGGGGSIASERAQSAAAAAREREERAREERQRQEKEARARAKAESKAKAREEQLRANEAARAQAAALQQQQLQAAQNAERARLLHQQQQQQQPQQFSAQQQQQQQRRMPTAAQLMSARAKLEAQKAGYLQQHAAAAARGDAATEAALREQLNKVNYALQKVGQMLQAAEQQQQQQHWGQQERPPSAEAAAAATAQQQQLQYQEQRRRQLMQQQQQQQQQHGVGALGGLADLLAQQAAAAQQQQQQQQRAAGAVPGLHGAPMNLSLADGYLARVRPPGSYAPPAGSTSPGAVNGGSRSSSGSNGAGDPHAHASPRGFNPSPSPNSRFGIVPDFGAESEASRHAATAAAAAAGASAYGDGSYAAQQQRQQQQQQRQRQQQQQRQRQQQQRAPPPALPEPPHARPGAAAAASYAPGGGGGAAYACRVCGGGGGNMVSCGICEGPCHTRCAVGAPSSHPTMPGYACLKCAAEDAPPPRLSRSAQQPQQQQQKARGRGGGGAGGRPRKNAAAAANANAAAAGANAMPSGAPQLMSMPPAAYAAYPPQGYQFPGMPAPGQFAAAPAAAAFAPAATAAAAEAAAAAAAAAAAQRADRSLLSAADRSWLQRAENAGDAYVPQVGDTLWYFPRGHAEMLRERPEARAAAAVAAASGRGPPWMAPGAAASAIDVAVLCQVQRIDYEFPTAAAAAARAAAGKPAPIAAALTLAPLSTDYPSPPFIVTHAPSDSADYMVPAARVAAATAQRWAPGDSMKMLFADGRRYGGRVVAVNCDAAGAPTWEGADIAWDGGEVSSVNLWELERPDARPRAKNAKRKSSSKNELSSQAQAAMATALTRLQEQEPDLAALFDDEVTDDVAPGYSTEVPLPMHLQLIIGRLEHQYYRHADAVAADLALIASNCELFNRADAPISAQARSFVGMAVAAVQRAAAQVEAAGGKRQRA